MRVNGETENLRLEVTENGQTFSFEPGFVVTEAMVHDRQATALEAWVPTLHVALGASGVLSACAEKGMMGWPGGQKMPPGPARLECQVIDGFYAFSTTPSGRTILTERMEVLV